jgi:hypothetical protein
MPAKMIRLRYAGRCSQCGAALAVGTKAWWDAETRSAACRSCRAEGAGGSPAIGPGGATRPAEPIPVLEHGAPGVSARREYERRHQRREQRINRRWGPLAGVVKLVSADPQSTTAWARGSSGEQRLARQLSAAIGDRAVLLHDRKVPGTRGNIDHLVVAASGVWVVDAKHYKGLIERRDVGGWFKTDARLYVGKRDRSKALAGMSWQLEAVRAALGGAEVPISAALCFIGGEWKLFAKPFQQSGVWVTWSKKLADMIAAPGPLGLEEVVHVAERLARALPPA